MPSAPGNWPKRLSKEWFSIMISMTCVTGTPGTLAETAAEGATTEDTAAVAARSGTPPAARSLERFTRPIVPAPGRRVLLRGPRFSYFAVITQPGRARPLILRPRRRHADTASMGDRNVLGGELEPCGTDPLTGFYRDGCCTTGPEDLGSHTICAVVTAEFLAHQRGIGNDLSTPMPQFSFPGLVPGDRWCVTAANWLRAHRDGAAAPVVLASTHERALEIVPLDVLRQYSVDVPADAGALDE